MNKVEITHNRDFNFILIFKDPSSLTKRLNLTNWSLIKIGLPQTGTTVKLIKQNTLENGIDEVQTITPSGVPTVGSFTMTTNSSTDPETTVPILFSEGAPEMQTALRALEKFKDATVTGTFGTTFVISFVNSDGKRKQELIVINLLGGFDVTLPIALTTQGEGKNGIEVISLEAGTIRVFGNEADAKLLLLGSKQNIAAQVRIEDVDVKFNEEGFKGILTVVPDPLTV